MSDTYMIEVNSEPAGIVVRSSQGFQFFAASHAFNALEGQLFKNARDAERAAYRTLHDRASSKHLGSVKPQATQSQDTVKTDVVFA